MRKDKFYIIPEYPLSCFPQGGNDGFVLGRSIATKMSFERVLEEMQGWSILSPLGEIRKGVIQVNNIHTIMGTVYLIK